MLVLGRAGALYLDGTRYGVLHMVGVGTRRAENGEHRVAEEVDDEAPMPRDNPDQESTVVVKDSHHLFATEPLGESRETAQVRGFAYPARPARTKTLYEGRPS